MFIGVDKFDDVWYNALSVDQEQNKSKSSFVTYHAFVFFTPPISSLSYKIWKNSIMIMVLYLIQELIQ